MFIEISIVVAVLSAVSGLTFNPPKTVVTSSVSSVCISHDSVSSLTLALSARQLGAVTNIIIATAESVTSPSAIFTTTGHDPSTFTTTGHDPSTFTTTATGPSATASPTGTPPSATASSTAPFNSITSTSTTTEAAPFSSSTTTTSSGSSTPIAIAPSAKKNPIRAIVGGVVGGVVALVLVGFFTFLSIRRRSRSRQDGFERGTFKHTEDEMKENPTTDRPVPLRKVVTTKDADISDPHAEHRANSPLHGPLFALFGSASPTLYSENPHSLRSADALPSLHDMHSDMSDHGSSVTISTARATLGGVRYKATSEADNISSQKTDGVSAPEQVNPMGVIHRDEEQPLDIVSSDSRGNTSAAPLPLQAPNQTEELNNQGHDLTTEEDVLLLELREVQIARRLVEIRSTRNRQTPPPQYASS
ncbi:hypothetical protein BT96DRAFT_938669 [Gymnopus androsaceus JB14]|uniref:Mid2 domain-containing protein n=1 Tax=Gymnopus androsaceus JB14 TaxID=1447944 RepID=A0A6A4HQW8_9AGAR|nr:hypothetical protein BT96DRAFT_938669 [Gymnopus androsaceus JB14]